MATWEEMAYLSYTFISQSLSEGNQGRNSEIGLEMETVKECCLLAYFLGSCSATFLISPRTLLSGIGPLSSVTNQENAPQIYLG